MRVTYTNTHALRSAHSNEFAKFSFIVFWSLSSHEAEQSSVASVLSSSLQTLHCGKKLNLAQHTDTLTLISNHKLFSLFFLILCSDFFFSHFAWIAWKEWEHKIKIRNKIHLMRPDDNSLISNLDLALCLSAIGEMRLNWTYLASKIDCHTNTCPYGSIHTLRVTAAGEDGNAFSFMRSSRNKSVILQFSHWFWFCLNFCARTK